MKNADKIKRFVRAKTRLEEYAILCAEFDKGKEAFFLSKIQMLSLQINRMQGALVDSDLVLEIKDIAKKSFGKIERIEKNGAITIFSEVIKERAYSKKTIIQSILEFENKFQKLPLLTMEYLAERLGLKIDNLSKTKKYAFQMAFYLSKGLYAEYDYALQSYKIFLKKEVLRNSNKYQKLTIRTAKKAHRERMD